LLAVALIQVRYIYRRVIKGIENSVDELTDYTCDIAKHLKVQTTPTYSTMTLPSKARQRRAANSEDRWAVSTVTTSFTLSTLTISTLTLSFTVSTLTSSFTIRGHP